MHLNEIIANNFDFTWNIVLKLHFSTKFLLSIIMDNMTYNLVHFSPSKSKPNVSLLNKNYANLNQLSI